MVRQGKAHGRLQTHSLTTSTLLNATCDWPGVGQVFQLVRDVRYLNTGKTTHELVYGITSLPKSQACAQDLLALHRQH